MGHFAGTRAAAWAVAAAGTSAVVAAACAPAGGACPRPAEPPAIAPPKEPAACPSSDFDWRRFAGEPLHILLPRYIQPQVLQGVYQLAPIFEQETGIQLELDTVSGDSYGTLATSGDKGSPGTDVIIETLDYEGFTAFQGHQVHDLDPLLADPKMTDPCYALDDFYPQFLEVARYDGKLYSIPLLFESYILIYNKRLVDKHLGGKLPETMDDLIKAAQSLSAEGRSWSTYGAMMRGVYSESIIDTATGVVFNSFDKARPAPLPYNLWFDGAWDRPRLTYDPIKRGLTQYAALLSAGPEPPELFNFEQVVSMFEENRLMFFIDASQFEYQFEVPGSTVARDTGYAVVPPIEKGGTSYTGFWQSGFSIPANVSPSHLGPAWYFIQYMTNRRAAPIVGMYTVGPTRRSTWYDPVYVRSVDPDYRKVVLQSLETARTTTVQNTSWDPMADAIVCAILQIEGGTNPDVATAEADAKIIEIAHGKGADEKCRALAPGSPGLAIWQRRHERRGESRRGRP